MYNQQESPMVESEGTQSAGTPGHDEASARSSPLHTEQNSVDHASTNTIDANPNSDNSSQNTQVLDEDALKKKKPKKKHKEFSNEFCFFITAIGGCVGSGNIWRFARIVALAGGSKGAGCFVLIWFLFLFTWSTPLIVAEYAVGRITRKTPIGSFWQLGGKYFTWPGVFTVVINVMICCYYSVITGWCLYYLFICIFWSLPEEVAESTNTFNSYVEGFLPLATHVIAISFAALSSIGGVTTIEKVNLLLVPGLLLILFGCFVRSLFLPGALAGIFYLFYPDFSILLNPVTWIEALSQICFDTGSGWGLFLTYANSLSDKSNVARLGSITPFGNNAVSIVSAMTMFGTTFAMLGSEMNASEVLDVMRTSGVAGTGMTFIYFPVLFSKMVMGRVMAIFFFLALAFAALSSLICNMNLPTKQLQDFGVPRLISLAIVSVFVFLVGSGSAVSVTVLSNQDAVWGSALILLGLLFASLIVKHGVKKVRKEYINKGAGFLWRKSMVYDFIIVFLVPIQGILLIGWWFVKNIYDHPTTFWNPIYSYDSLANTLIQWFLALTFSILSNVIVTFIYKMYISHKKKAKNEEEGNAQSEVEEAKKYKEKQKGDDDKDAESVELEDVDIGYKDV